MNQVQRIRKAFFQAFRPPPEMTLSQWADANAILSAESSAEAGRWKTIPYQRGIQDSVTDSSVELVVVMKSARVGFTKILNNAIGYHIDQDPCSIMLVQPTIEDAEGYSKEEIAPMLRDTPCLAGKVSDAKAKDGSNTILTKVYPGGTLGLVGANSPRGFRRVSRRVVLLDEVDGYPPSAGTEGDQIKLATKRTEYFWNRKIVAGSTPTTKGLSRIERMFESTDQRRFYVPCPECGHFQYLQWKNMKWEPESPQGAYFECEDKGCKITHDKKRWMIENAERLGGGWRATAKSENPKHTGFHIWAAYSYSPNASWGALVVEFLEAKNDPETLKTFVNTALGETWEEDYSAKVGADGLRARMELYEPRIVPAAAFALTCGVDVQDNRLAVGIYGWGRGEECWLVDKMEIFGDPSAPELWKQLDNILLKAHPHELGGEMKITSMGVDSGGHYTHEVYQYVRARKKLGVFAVKGSSQKGRPAIGKPRKVDVNFKGKSLKSGADLYLIGTDTIKGTLFGRLKHAEPGPGYIHFFTIPIEDDFFDQLTSEKQLVRYVRGNPVRDWVKKKGARNEALDCFVYAYAALRLLCTRFNPATMWDQLERKLHIAGVAASNSETPGPAPNSEKDPLLQKSSQNNRINPNRRKGGFVGRF